MWGKNEGACVPRWRGETRRGRLRAEGRRNDRENELPYLRSTPRYNGSRAFGRRRVPQLVGHRGRSAEGCRNDRENEPSYLRSTPRYNESRAFGCRGVPSLDGHRVRLPKGAATIEQVRHRAMGSAGAGRAAAAVGKRRRERDAELQIQAPRLTVRR